MMAAPSSAGNARAPASRCKRCLSDAASRLNGGRPVASAVAGPHRCRRARRGAGGSAFASRALPGRTNPRCTELPLEAASRGGAGSGSRAARAGTPASRRSAACLSLSHSQSPRPSRPAKLAAFGTCKRRSIRRLCRRRPRCCSDGTTSPLSVPPPARRAALCARWTGSTSHANGDMIEILAEARSFLHHQVRNMVGTLKLVGERRWQPDRVATALQRRDRSAAGPTAPADGLCLTGVRYPIDPFTSR